MVNYQKALVGVPDVHPTTAYYPRTLLLDFGALIVECLLGLGLVFLHSPVVLWEIFMLRWKNPYGSNIGGDGLTWLRHCPLSLCCTILDGMRPFGTL